MYIMFEEVHFFLSPRLPKRISFSQLNQSIQVLFYHSLYICYALHEARCSGVEVQKKCESTFFNLGWQEISFHRIIFLKTHAKDIFSADKRARRNMFFSNTEGT